MPDLKKGLAQALENAPDDITFEEVNALLDQLEVSGDEAAAATIDFAELELADEEQESGITRVRGTISIDLQIEGGEVAMPLVMRTRKKTKKPAIPGLLYPKPKTVHQHVRNLRTILSRPGAKELGKYLKRKDFKKLTKAQLRKLIDDLRNRMKYMDDLYDDWGRGDDFKDSWDTHKPKYERAIEELEELYEGMTA
jgi:hypothetical protein